MGSIVRRQNSEHGISKEQLSLHLCGQARARSHGQPFVFKTRIDGAHI